jgi:hypothetical protein
LPAKASRFTVFACQCSSVSSPLSWKTVRVEPSAAMTLTEKTS